MNILFVNNFRGRGGGEEFLRDLLPGLAQKGAKIGLICRPGTPLQGMFPGSGINVYPIERSGSGFLTSVFQIAKIIKRENYEIVNIQRGHDIIQSWVAALLSLKRPVLIYTPQVAEFKRSRFLLGRLDKIITISRHIRDKIVDFFPALSEKTSIIYYGIDLGKFRPDNAKPGLVKARFGLAPETRIIGTVGDLWKNQIEFLDALAEIRKALRDVRFALVAEKSDNADTLKFKERAARLGLADAVLWVGRLSKDEMLSFYADIDIVVSTHRNEGFGIWILEALAVGKPAVAFNAGGILDSLENCPAGVLVNGGARELAIEIVRILKDKELLQRSSDAARRWVADRFSKERMIADYFEFFTSAVKE